jgi:hypothetical protein
MIDTRRYLVLLACLLPVVLCSRAAGGAGAPCVDTATIERATLSPATARYFYMDCVVVDDSRHPFLARLPAERRGAATDRLKDKAAQTLACTANPRDPARSGLKKKDMVVLASCKPARVKDVWALP